MSESIRGSSDGEKSEVELQKFTWIDQLKANRTAEIEHLFQQLRIYSLAIETLHPDVLNWGISIATRVVEEVRELRRTEGISVVDGAEKLEQLACTAGVITTLVSLRAGIPVRQAPDEMLQQIRSAFHQGGDLPSVIRFVWSHHVRFQERLLIAQRSLATDVDQGTEIQDLHSRMNEILDVYISSIDTEFRLEQQRSDGGAPARRRLLIEQVLRGEEPTSLVEEALGVPLSGDYFFLQISSERGLLGDDRREELRRLRGLISNDLGGGSGFGQELGENSALWCFTLQTGSTFNLRERIRKASLPHDLRVGVGPIVRGVVDLARGILGSAIAHGVSENSARHVVSGRADVVFFEDVRLLGLMKLTRPEMEIFLNDALGDLSRDTEKNSVLRETLLAYLLRGKSRKEAAKLLHISPNTVAYRVAQAREISGQRVIDDSVDVLVALQILEYLPGFGGSTDN